MTEPVSARVIFTDEETPFRSYEPWPLADDSLELIDVGPECARMPLKDLRQGLEDGFVTFMLEAWRCLKPGGTLTVRGPTGGTDPENVRYFAPATFHHFGKPENAENFRAPRHRYPTNYLILNNVDEGAEVVCTMEKPE